MNCKNCNTELQKQDIYCRSCGGKIIRNRLSFKNIFEHLSETFFNYDNKLLRTIIDLIKTPETVIDGYVTGVRKRYVNPISFFGVSLTLTGFSIFIIKKFYKNTLDVSQYFDVPELYTNEVSQNIMANSADFSLEYSSLIYASMIPVFALMSWVIFLNKRYNYTEHLVTYMYSMSTYSIISVIFGLLILIIAPSFYMAFSMSLYIAALLYHCFLLKRLFKTSIKEIILKTFLFLILLVIVFVILSLITGVIMIITMYLSGDLETMMETQKAAAEAAKSVK